MWRGLLNVGWRFERRQREQWRALGRWILLSQERLQRELSVTVLFGNTFGGALWGEGKQM